MTLRKKHLIVVIGPTAIGKTSRAIEIANHFECAIISCDSRQFFQEMSIGTAVPSESELAAAKHYFIHNKSVFENYTVGDFEKDAVARLDMLFRQNDYAVLVGGSGLYVDAVLKGFDDFPQVDKSVRAELTENYRIQGIGYLQKELKRLDPDYFAVVDTGNKQRIMRALEISIGTGKPYSSFLASKETKRTFTPIIIGLTADRELMYDRINRRVDIMISEGLLEEAKTLYRHRELNALQTVGYRELFAYLDGETTLESAIEEIKKNTRRFAKRQMTWFRKTESVRWFDLEAKIDEIIAYIKQKTTDSKIE